MSFRLICISTVCSTARLDKHERRHQSFGSFVGSFHLEQMYTLYTGPAMRKALIKHQRSTSNAKIELMISLQTQLQCYFVFIHKTGHDSR